MCKRTELRSHWLLCIKRRYSKINCICMVKSNMKIVQFQLKLHRIRNRCLHFVGIVNKFYHWNALAVFKAIWFALLFPLIWNSVIVERGACISITIFVTRDYACATQCGMTQPKRFSCHCDCALNHAYTYLSTEYVDTYRLLLAYAPHITYSNS